MSSVLADGVYLNECNNLKVCLCVFRLDFEYLNNLPVLILDVEDDFKNDRIKQEAIIDKVLSYFICLYFGLLFFTSENLYSAISSDLESVFSRRSESFSPRCRNVCDVICWLDDPVTHCKCFLLDCQNFLCFLTLLIWLFLGQSVWR